MNYICENGHEYSDSQTIDEAMKPDATWTPCAMCAQEAEHEQA